MNAFRDGKASISLVTHAEWRKLAKRERRRKIRTHLAKERDKLLHDESWMKEQEMLELMLLEQIERTNSEENDKWLCAERKAIEDWQVLQEHKKILQQKELEQKAKMKLEWEKEKQRKKEEQERLKAIEEANKIKEELFIKNLEEFLSGDTQDPPEALQVVTETRPGTDLCTFFAKTACCRFGDQCSRNHQYPAISKVLLAPNFYSHFGLNNTTENEYDTDIMLEYEDTETYKEYKEFFNDVLSELEKFGKIVQFRVCNNYEKHLRGNMYIEYAELRCAVAAYRALHARWYAGRRLALHFCFINSWRNAICGMHLKKRCPKGRACNFLHVFKNPHNLFSSYNTSHIQTPDSERSRRTPPRSWRWSESPEVEISRKSRRDEDRSERRRRERDRNRRYESDSKRHRSRDKRSLHRSQRSSERQPYRK